MKILYAHGPDALDITVEKLLSENGHDVIPAGSLEDVLTLHKTLEPDMILLDCDLTGEDTVTVTRKLRKQEEASGKRCYIILLLEDAKKEDIIELLEAGVDDIVTKPYSIQILESRITVGFKINPSLKSIEDEKKGEPVKVSEDNIPPLLAKPDNPIEHLMQEHKLILRMAAALEAISVEFKGKEIPEKILNWYQETAFLLDSSLHHKKEYFLILTFVERAVFEQGGESPIFSHASFSKIEEEHAVLEKLLKRMEKEVSEYLAGNQTAKQMLKTTIDKYVMLVRSHAALEDTVFFPLIGKYLTPEDNKHLISEFLRVNRELSAKGLAQRLKELEMVERVMQRKRT